MSCMRYIGAVSLIFAACAVIVARLTSTGQYTRLPLTRQRWGPLHDLVEPADILEFTIPDWLEEEEFAKNRLNNPCPHPVPHLMNTSRIDGVNHDELAVLASEWSRTWSWRASPVVASLRSLPQYTWRIDGIDIHFIHVKRLTLLLLHGWPGSVLEFVHILPLLTSRCGPGGTIFDVVAPSLPGFGFSSVPNVPGLGVLATAELLIRLMGRLGYNKHPNGWFVQGGDWGGVIAVSIAQILGAATSDDRQFFRLPTDLTQLPLRGVHVNFIPAIPPWSSLVYAVSSALPSSLQWVLWGSGEAGALEYERSGLPLSKLLIRLVEALGYLHLQATRPDTLAVALHDSPLATLAWLHEKFSAWSDLSAHNGSAIDRYGIDWLLASVSLYHYSGTAASSLRYYRESLSDASFVVALLTSPRADIPFAVADFPHEIMRVPEWFSQSKLPGLAAYDTFPRGGHFAAMEEPELLATHIHETLGRF